MKGLSDKMYSSTQEKINLLRRHLDEVKSRNNLKNEVILSFPEYINMIENLLDIAENQIFTEDELYQIWQALITARYVDNDELINKVKKIAKRFVKKERSYCA